MNMFEEININSTANNPNEEAQAAPLENDAVEACDNAMNDGDENMAEGLGTENNQVAPN